MELQKSLSILIIDDSEVILDMLSQLLKENSAVNRIICVNSAFDGLWKIEECTPDIVILDINLPVMSGIQVLRRVRMMQVVQPVIIMLTNNTMTRYKEECLNIGADYFLDKSRDFMKIQEIINNSGVEGLII
ncbi:MAG: response regulator [Sphingobacteriia bacterium]|nr:response regulator [Sphingobacteriia bacterium]